MSHRLLLAPTVIVATLAACTSTPSAVVTPAAVPGLRDGVALYDKGDYNGAVRRLGQADLTGANKSTQLSALKYSAFSYCVTSRTTLCRQTFDKAFKLDPAFDLAPGEHGHPLWGPVFLKAKKAR
ncbi:MAG: hypothetical protein JWP59_3562 [Massilia sp.]|nr:hypothetical protein [Massilia sp.]